MPMGSLHDALVHELKDLLSAEKQLTAALPKMAKHASSEPLRQAFTSHLEETEGHVERLKQAFEALDRTPRSEKCEAMAGLIKEAESVLEQKGEPETMDALLIAAAQKVEHYEVASYGTVLTWAKQLGLREVADILKPTMAEEEAADKKLTQIATSGINREAAAMSA